MRNVSIAQGELYHLYGRGNQKRPIFHEKNDYARFLFAVLCLQSPANFPNTRRHIGHIVQHSVLNNVEDVAAAVSSNRYVQLVAFALMPNHYHLIAREISGDGIPKYMHRVLNGYAKYYNTKYDSSGHLFQGPYGAKPITSDEQLAYLSAYVHRNPREIRAWKNREHLYPWSSYSDYIVNNRWKILLDPSVILDRFSGENDYRSFVAESGAKENLELV